MISPDHAAALEVAHDALQQIRTAQQSQRRRSFLLRHFDLGVLRFQRLFDLLLLQHFQTAQQQPQLALDALLFDFQLHRCLLGIDGALPRRVQVERVHVEAGDSARRLSLHQHVHPQCAAGCVLVEVEDAIAPRPLRDPDFLTADFNRQIDRRASSQRRS